MTLPRTPDDLLTTTRAVRFRLDLDRTVDPVLIEQCVDIATQAPSGRNRQRWSFVAVTDAERRRRLAEIVRGPTSDHGAEIPRGELENAWAHPESMRRTMNGQAHLMANLHRVPVLLVPCVDGRTDGASLAEQSRTWGSILPATWSFMLAARARGLGTVWTTPPQLYEPAAEAILGLPPQTMPVALIPVAHTHGTDFRRGKRIPLGEVLHWETW